MIEIYRTPSTKDGTFGTLHIDGIPQCLTLEPVDPIIPDGTYDCIPHSGTKFKNVWEITGVPNHSAVLIHPGNHIGNTEGCVLVGIQFGKFEGRRGLQNSRLALDTLRQILPRNFKLQIRSIK